MTGVRVDTRTLRAGLRIYAGWAVLTARADLPPVCPFRRLTGRACPFCGLTRATGSALRGRLREARSRHRLGPVVALLVLADVADRATAGRRSRPGEGPGATTVRPRW